MIDSPYGSLIDFVDWFDDDPDWIVFQWKSEAAYILPSERHCFQCGHLHFIGPDNPAKDSWVECEKCRSRVVSLAELKDRMDAAQEARIGEKWKVREFLEARRIDPDFRKR